MTCPIISSCWKTLHDHLFEGSRKHLYSDVEEAFQDVWEQQEAKNPDRIDVLLRGFYATELLYHSLLPQTATELKHAEVLQAFKQRAFGRSTEGMTELIKEIDVVNKRVQVDTGILALTNKESHQESKFQRTNMQRVIPMLRITKEAAEKMREGLDGKSRLTRVGELLGEGFIYGHIIPEACLSHMKSILTINQQNAMAPWTNRLAPA